MQQRAETILPPESTGPLPVRPCIALALIIAAATLSLYGPTVGFEFTNYDDPKYVSDNPAVQQGLSVQNIGYAFTETGMSDWYPMLYLSYMADVTMFGADNPGAHHGVNAALHTANAILLFLLLIRWTGLPWPSALVAGLFALHPLHVESVTWISMRKDVLGTFFALLAVASYTAYTRRQERNQSAWKWYIAVTILFALGCMNKANIIMLPAALLLLDIWPLRRADLGEPAHQTCHRLLRLGLEKLPWCVISLAIAVVHLQITSESVEDRPDLSLLQSLAIAIVSYAGHLLHLVWPVGLACWYPHPAKVDPEFLQNSAFLTRLSVSSLVLGTITALTLWQARQRPYLLAGWLWYILTLLPSSGLVSFASFYLADRYVYLPFWGIYWILAWGVWDLLRNRPKIVWVAGGAAGLALVACFVLSWQQVRVWRDTETLMRHAITNTRDNAFAHNNLASTLLQQRRWDDALTQLEHAISIQPDYAMAHNNMGTALLELGRMDEAIEAFNEALRLDEDLPTVHYHLGNAMLQNGEADQAVLYFQQAVKIDPEHAEAHNNLGNALQLSGDAQGSLASYRRALAIAPGYAEASYNLANGYIAMQRLDDAINQYRKTIKINPEYALAHNNLGSALMLMGRQDEALKHYESAIQIAPKYAAAHRNRGDALKALARAREAIESYRRALTLEPNNISTLVALADAHARRREFDQARAQIETALKIAPDNLKPALQERLEQYQPPRPRPQ